MRLVTIPRCFDGYDLTLLPKAIVEMAHPNVRRRTVVNAAVLRFQCLCEIAKVDLSTCSVEEVSAWLNEFAAASFSVIFLAPAAKPWHALSVLRQALPPQFTIRYPTTSNRNSWSDAFRRRVEFYDCLSIDRDQAEFWRGWSIENKSRQIMHLKLWRIWQIFGPDFTRDLFFATQTWFSTGHYERVPAIQDFIDHCTQHPHLNFSNSNEVGSLILDFFQRFFKSGVANGTRLTTLRHQWRTFANFLSSHMLGFKWANPVPAIPTPPTRKVPGTVSHVKTTERGHDVKVSLITPIPLHITDSQAKELLFRDIRDDVSAVSKWARAEVNQARSRMEDRKTSARNGIATVIGSTGTNTGTRFRLSRECPEHLVHAAATFEKYGFDLLSAGRLTEAYYPVSVIQTTWELGLPIPALLLAHAALLVSEHPVITPTFLEKAELYDTNGRLVGLHETDAGWYLRSTKLRRGATLAEQDILLTAETLQVVRDVIALTEPARAWLRKRNDPLWTRLFLSVTSLGRAPSAWSATDAASYRTKWLADRLHELGEVSRERAAYLADRFSLKKLRSSSAVLIYIETGSVERMAKALGHQQWVPSLLDHYLPRPIQEFFTERWIRIFQSGIICEALRDSPYLLEASDFQTIDELDDFLENHALRRVPEHLKNPDEVGGGDALCRESTRILFSVDVGVLTILVSLIAAVQTASRLPCGRAIRWARIGDKLISHLETQTEQPEFRVMLDKARRGASAGKVKGIIYG